MVVVFSHDAFFQRYGGVSRCMVELMRHLEGQGQVWRAVAGRYGSCFLKVLHDAGRAQITGTWEANAPGRISAGFRNEPGFSRAVSSMADVVVHRSYYPVIDLLPAHVPVVVTLHDMYWEAPETRRSFRFWLHSRLKRKALARADRIICISQFTLDELTRYWPEFADKAEVIYHGVSALAPTPATEPILRNQFIFVGDRGNRKNFEAAVSGLAESGLEGHQLLCVGGGPLTPDEHSMIERHRMTGRVKQSPADDDMLAACYASSTALLYPSTYEGFGMPLLEAMLHGCPVIAARASCLPEVGGEAALYADPHSPAEWAAAMRDICQPSLRGKMIQRGRHHVQNFKWQQIAQSYSEVYLRLKSTN